MRTTLVALPLAKCHILHVCFSMLAALAAFFISPCAARAGQNAASADTPFDVFIPYFVDPQRRVEKPESLGRLHIRFITSADFPPFAFQLPDGSLGGFDIDLARALCEKLDYICSIQSVAFEEVLDDLKSGHADGAIGGLLIPAGDMLDKAAPLPTIQPPVSNENAGGQRESSLSANFTADADPAIIYTMAYFRNGARLVAKTGASFKPSDILIGARLAGEKIGIVRASIYDAFARRYFRDATIIPFDTLAALREALKKGDIALMFDSALSSALWLNGSDSDGCCAFAGMGFWNRTYFGDGAGIAFTREHQPIRDAFDYALLLVVQDGTYRALFLKYFPQGLF